MFSAFNYQEASIHVIEQSPQEQNPRKGEEQKPGAGKHKEPERQAAQLTYRAERSGDNVLSHTHMRPTAGAKVWNIHPWLLGTKQGVIDLRTGTLRPGRPNDHIRAIVPTEWKGLDEPAPRFQQFLREIFGEREEAEREELIAFLQRALGYGITGNANEHIFLMLFGEGKGDGRDALIRALAYVLGKAVGAISNKAVTVGRRSSIPKTRLCSLQGKRIVWVSETGRDARYAIERVKQLTGGGTIVARRLCTGEYTFDSSHLLILLANRKPEAATADGVFWDRLCPIVFNLRFVDQPEHPDERKRDPRLNGALKSEASGILAWLVRGSLEWYRLGLAIPACVRRVRQEYRAGGSGVLNFVQQCCVLDAEARTFANLLYTRYKNWADNAGLTPVDDKRFDSEMKQVGQVAWQSSKRGNVYRGIRFQDEEEAAD